MASATATPAHAHADPTPGSENDFRSTVECVYRFAYGWTGNRQEAEDITSRVFLEAASQRGGQSWESFRERLMSAAALIVQEHRLRYGTVVDARPGVQCKDENASVHTLLAALPASYRQVLELRLIGGRSIRATAKALGTTKRAALRLQSDALRSAAMLKRAAPPSAVNETADAENTALSGTSVLVGSTPVCGASAPF